MEENLTYISGFTADIFISAPRYVRVNQSFVLKCSSFDVPRMKKAEFKLVRFVMQSICSSVF
jgi:hypothetical protein